MLVETSIRQLVDVLFLFSRAMTTFLVRNKVMIKVTNEIVIQKYNYSEENIMSLYIRYQKKVTCNSNDFINNTLFANPVNTHMHILCIHISIDYLCQSYPI